MYINTCTCIYVCVCLFFFRLLLTRLRCVFLEICPLKPWPTLALILTVVKFVSELTWPQLLRTSTMYVSLIHWICHVYFHELNQISFKQHWINADLVKPVCCFLWYVYDISKVYLNRYVSCGINRWFNCVVCYPQIWIFIQDGGRPPLSDVGVVEITIQRNQYRPRITSQTPVTLTISETESLATVLYTTTAIDLDPPVSCTYKLHSYVLSAFFVIWTTGIIISDKNLMACFSILCHVHLLRTIYWYVVKGTHIVFCRIWSVYTFSSLV